MKTIQYTVTISDLIAYNEYIFWKRTFKFLGIIVAAIWVFPLISNILVGDYGTVMLNLVTIIFSVGLMGLSVRYSKGVAISSLVIFLLIGSFVFLGGNGGFISRISLVPLLVPYLVFGLFGIGWKQYLKYFYGGKTNSIGEHTLTIDDKGVDEKTKFSEGRVGWDLITGIDEDKKNIYLLLGRSKAYVIPKSSFGGPANSEAFFAEAQKLKRG